MTQRRTVSSGSEYESLVGYSRAVRTGPSIAVAGTTGAGDDIAAQTRDALRRIEISLQEAGGALADVARRDLHGFRNTSETETAVMAWSYHGAASLDEAGYVPEPS